jgi:hypothetical protein
MMALADMRRNWRRLQHYLCLMTMMRHLRASWPRLLDVIFGHKCSISHTTPVRSSPNVCSTEMTLEVGRQEKVQGDGHRMRIYGCLTERKKVGRRWGKPVLKSIAVKFSSQNCLDPLSFPIHPSIHCSWSVVCTWALESHAFNLNSSGLKLILVKEHVDNKLYGHMLTLKSSKAWSGKTELSKTFAGILGL